MLLLASIASTTPNCFRCCLLPETTLRRLTRRPLPRRARRRRCSRVSSPERPLRSIRQLRPRRLDEEARRKRHAALLELVEERRTQPGRAKAADDGPVGLHALDLEDEQLLKRD